MAATTQMQLIRDIAGYPQTLSNSSRLFANTCQYFTLTANVVTTVTVPTTADGPLLAFFNFTADNDVWVQLGSVSVLALPTGVVTDTTACLNPTGRRVLPGQTIQFLTAGAAVSVGIEYYQTNQ